MAKNSLSAGQTYGDSQRLEGVKKAGGSFGPTVQRSPAGRPAAGAMVPQTPVVATGPAPEVPREHQALMDRYARALRADKKIQDKAAAEDAGPLVRFYAALSRQQLKRAASDLDQQTPRFL